MYPHNRLKLPPNVPMLSEGNELRTYQMGDQANLAKLLESEGWGKWRGTY